MVPSDKPSLEASNKPIQPSFDYTLKIPDHVLELVFEKLSEKFSVQVCFQEPSRVCRRWHNIICTSTRIWRYVYLNGDTTKLDGCPLLQENSAVSKYVESLTVGSGTVNLELLIKRLRRAKCYKIKYLVFLFAFDAFTTSIVPFVYQLGEALDTLYIRSSKSMDASVILPRILSTCKNLTELHILDTRESGFTDSEHMFDDLELGNLKLKCLTMEISRMRIQKLCNFLRNHCPLLVKLSLIDYAGPIHPQDLEKLYYFPRLHSYSLKLVPKTTEITQWRGYDCCAVYKFPEERHCSDQHVSSSLTLNEQLVELFDDVPDLLVYGRQPWKSLCLNLRNIWTITLVERALQSCPDVETLEFTSDAHSCAFYSHAGDAEDHLSPVLGRVQQYHRKLRHIILNEEAPNPSAVEKEVSLAKKHGLLAVLERVTLNRFRHDIICSNLYAWLAPLLRLPSVNFLGLRESQAFTSAHIYILHDLSIEKLHLMEMTLDDGWIKSLEYWRKLKMLYFEDCIGVTEEFLVALITRIHTLNFVYIKPSYILDEETRNWTQMTLASRGGSLVTV